MERKIVFRGYNLYRKEWLYGNFAQCKDGSFSIDGVPVETDSVGQFTGLLDKNGKEIYENDRVNVLQAERNFDIVVKWSNEAMAFMACHADGKQSPFSWFTNLRIYQLTVIGNIHDTPSLISDKQ